MLFSIVLTETMVKLIFSERKAVLDSIHRQNDYIFEAKTEV